MKILHTADWHLGKKVNGISRLDEQKAILQELIGIVEKNSVDVVLVAGDIFNVSTAPQEVYELFYETVLALSNSGNRAVIVVNGNNDEGSRLTASKQFAEQFNIFLIDSLDYEVITSIPKGKAVQVLDIGKGYIKIEKGGERAIVCYLPFPSRKLLSEAKMHDATKDEKIKKLIERSTINFEAGAVNIFLSHIQVEATAGDDSNLTHKFDISVLPKKADYVALGGFHDMGQVEGMDTVYYSGSTTQINPKEQPEKYVIILNTENSKIVNKEFVKIKNARRIVTFSVKNYEDALKKLSGNEAHIIEMSFVEGTISKEEISELKKNFQNIAQFNIHTKLNTKTDKQISELLPTTAFSEFHQEQTGEKPNEIMQAVFKEIFNK
ncbi:MAG: exonuclease subunit SbcD [Firmicutes bacterium]|nr:exonuclease subunit SbcD [Bacillota bacterium]